MKTGFFEEAPGNSSMTRLLVFLLIVYAIVMSACIGIVGLVQYYHGKDTLMNVIVAAGAFLTSISTFAAGWKLIQKPMEKTNDQDSTSTEQTKPS
jgi:hypothetical protein